MPLLALLVLRAYRPDLLGIAGWLVAAGAVVAFVRSGKVGWPTFPKLVLPDRVALIGILLAAVLAAAFPADPYTSGSDLGTYASHAVYIAHHGRLDVAYPWPSESLASAGFPTVNDIGRSPIRQLYPSLALTEPAMTVQFAHLYPAWLAQAFAVGGYEALVRLNVILMVFSLLAIYGLIKRVANAPVAAFATVFLAFNPSELWVAKQVLAETAAQLVTWSALLLVIAFLSRGTRLWGVWAGVLFGVTAALRVDGFLLAPFLVGGHALWNVVRLDSRAMRASWKWVYMGAAPAFVAAFTFYALFNQPYLVLISGQLIQIAGLILASAVALVLTRSSSVATHARETLFRRSVVGLLVCVLVGLAVYAYFFRPEIPPFATYDVPGATYDGARTYAELAFQNLARYLTPAVLWGAIAGWALSFCAVCWRTRAAVLAPLVVVVLGATAIYAWDPSHFPNHLFVIRRYIPVIIPGLVLFAAVAATFLIRRLSRPGRRLAIGLSATLLAVFTIGIGAPIYAVTERRGTYEALSRFAQSVPGDGSALSVDGPIDAVSY